MSPNTLQGTQAWLVDAITLGPDATLGVEHVIAGSPRLTPRERLEIYRSGYRARLVECLADDYPVVLATLGPSRFEALSHAYVERHPSRSPNLNAFGRHMAEFCRCFALPGVDSAFLAELAALEWALVEAIHAPGAPPLDVEKLQSFHAGGWTRVRFSPSPAVRLLRFEYPVNAYFRRYHESGEVPPAPAPEPTATAVYRQARTVWRADLSRPAATLLEALLGGVPMGAALESVSRGTDPEVLATLSSSVGDWFRWWCEAGFFADASDARQ